MAIPANIRRVAAAAALLLTAAVGWMLYSRAGKKSSVASGPATVSLTVQIKGVEVRPAGDHAQLMLTAVFDKSEPEPVRLEPPVVSLLNARQVPAVRFLGPMLPDPVLTGTESAEITLHWWVPMTDLQAPLTLEATGRRYEVKLPASL